MAYSKDLKAFTLESMRQMKESLGGGGKYFYYSTVFKHGGCWMTRKKKKKQLTSSLTNANERSWDGFRTRRGRKRTAFLCNPPIHSRFSLGSVWEKHKDWTFKGTLKAFKRNYAPMMNLKSFSERRFHISRWKKFYRFILSPFFFPGERVEKYSSVGMIHPHPHPQI